MDDRKMLDYYSRRTDDRIALLEAKVDKLMERNALVTMLLSMIPMAILEMVRFLIHKASS